MSQIRRTSVQDLVLHFEEKCKLSKSNSFTSCINVNLSRISQNSVKSYQEKQATITKEIISDCSADVCGEAKHIIDHLNQLTERLTMEMSDNKATTKPSDYKPSTLGTLANIEDEYVSLDSLREMRQSLQHKVKQINITAIQINNICQSKTSSDNESNRSSSSQDDMVLYGYHTYENIFALNTNQSRRHDSENSDRSNTSTPDNNYDYVTITKYDPVSMNQKRNSSALHYKTLLTVYDEQKPTQTEISKVATGPAKKQEVQKYKDKKDHIVDELITSEGTYIANLKLTLHRYPDKIRKVIGDAKTKEIFSELYNILNGSINLLRAIDKIPREYDLIGQIFLDHKELFELYPTYCKNKTRSEKLCRMYSKVIESIEKEHADLLGLSSHLLLPIQRLAKYILLLNKLTKELIKDDLPADRVKSAADLIHNITHKGNDLVELNSIFGKAYELRDTGHFIMRDHFRMIAPKKTPVTLFLFQHKIIITVRDKYRHDNYFYFMDINMSELCLSSEEYNKTTFSLSKDKKHAFKVNAKEPAIKARWINAIGNILWKELEKERRKIIELYNSEFSN